jgi:hypothetical protein
MSIEVILPEELKEKRIKKKNRALENKRILLNMLTYT